MDGVRAWIVNFPSCEWCGYEMASRPALHKDGGQALQSATPPQRRRTRKRAGKPARGG